MKRMNASWRVSLGTALLAIAPTVAGVSSLAVPQTHWVFDKVLLARESGVSQRLETDGQSRLLWRSNTDTVTGSTMSIFDSNGAPIASWACDAQNQDDGFGVNAGGKIVAWCGGNLQVRSTQGQMLFQAILPEVPSTYPKQVVVRDDGSFVATVLVSFGSGRFWSYNAAGALVDQQSYSPPAGISGFRELPDGRFLINGKYAYNPDGTYAGATPFAESNNGNVTVANGLILGSDPTCGAGQGAVRVVDMSFRTLSCFGTSFGGINDSSDGPQLSAFFPDGSVAMFFAVHSQVVRFKQAGRTFPVAGDYRINPQVLGISSGTFGGHAVLNVDYVLHYGGAAPLTTAVLAFDQDGDSFASIRTISIAARVDNTAGNVGAQIPTETVKRLTWDVTQDLGSTGVASVSVEVLASDGRPLIDIPFVEIPAGIPNQADPPLVISTWGLDATKSAWYWLIATGDSRITFSNGEVRGSATSGVFSGQLLASDAGNTTQGEDFLCFLLNVRRATQAEIDRARAGTTPGVQSYAPVARVGGNPVLVNEIGVDVAGGGLMVVKL